MLFEALYFMLPVYFANMAPIIVKDIFGFLAKPLDWGQKIGGKPIFGANKTFRGFIFAIIFAIFIAYLQNLVSDYGIFATWSMVDYSQWLIIGFLAGFGAIFGDLIESFIKRRLGKESGSRFVPWDQIDFVIGSLLFLSLVVQISIAHMLIILVASFVLHITVNHISFFLGVRKEKW